MTTESSTSILVRWGEVPAIDRNGIITQYEVAFEPLETFGGQLTTMTMLTNASTFELLLDNLEEYVEYNITIWAGTDVGLGVASSPISIQTNEDGEFVRPWNFNHLHCK